MRPNALRQLSAVVPLVLACACWTNATAQTLYAVDAQAKQLLTLSTVDGTSSLVGSFDIPGGMAGLTYDGDQDILYGSSVGDFVTPGKENLYRIDRATGAATLIGPLGVSGMGSLTYVNGVLYGASTGDGTPESSLYRINTTTGAATLIGNIGVWGFGGRVSGMAFNPYNNTLYGCLNFFGPDVGGIVSIDIVTGRGTLLFNTRPFQGLSFHPETGVLYGIHNGFGIQPDSLSTIDLNSQTMSLVGLTGLGSGLDLAFVPIPEPSTLAIISLAFALIAWKKARRWQR